MGISQLSQSDSSGAGVAAARSINIAILAMGGEGGGVLADWIVDLAENSGYLAQTTSVPGVAQRTGSTIYYVELFPEELARAAGKDPVLALMPVPGEVDVVIASELMEAGRAITRGLVTPDRTTLIASTNRVYSMSEKIAMGDGRADADAFLKAGGDAARIFIPRDFAGMAEESRSVISATLFGALAGAGSLPFSRKQFESAIERSAVSVTTNVKAFAAGFDAATSREPAKVEPIISAVPKPGPALASLAARITSGFPASSHAILLAGIERLADYQDVTYASTYLDRLEPIRNLVQRSQTDAGKKDSSLLSETARYLALWMSYEDAIRVADLKTRRARFERVHAEARVADDQLLLINEFLHPRVEEFADILPAGLGSWLLKTGWASRLVNRLTGKGKILQTTSLSGFLQLYWLASLRRWRPKTLRFKREQQWIQHWLEQVKDVAQADHALALELADCPRLVKGYGDTYALGSRNFESLMQALPTLRQMDNAAAHLKTLREAALADDTGKKLETALAELNLLPGGSL
ncbi:MAG TPA: indolepyruvate oxidoreductase subunit beta family protein [Candidatus Dormibacteraeota bacterium]|jgi:indolepyruvate ferredoxin oxidoreductase beta subunit|nr:indolepyruvate oxidoreductase subunit beta family protein [Candidatus Dormibacteraeota bacterium]